MTENESNRPPLLSELSDHDLRAELKRREVERLNSERARREQVASYVNDHKDVFVGLLEVMGSQRKATELKERDLDYEYKVDFTFHSDDFLERVSNQHRPMRGY
jgi:hypothetical protein